jgi:hypothetical protein
MRVTRLSPLSSRSLDLSHPVDAGSSAAELECQARRLEPRTNTELHTAQPLSRWRDSARINPWPGNRIYTYLCRGKLAAATIGFEQLISRPALLRHGVLTAKCFEPRDAGLIETTRRPLFPDKLGRSYRLCRSHVNKKQQDWSAERQKHCHDSEPWYSRMLSTVAGCQQGPTT